jgi:cytochrome c-type biogenesis protein CcmH/NrfG
MMLDALQQAKQSYNKVLELNPNNLQAKTALAVCIIQGDNDVMKGVGLLKEVVAKDSNNVQAIFTLGMLSIQSNQLDKAQERFEKLIKIEPFNAEYYFYLAEVYAKSGDTKKAVKTYETCKTLVKDKEAQKEIDAIIEKLNKL